MHYFVLVKELCKSLDGALPQAEFRTVAGAKRWRRALFVKDCCIAVTRCHHRHLRGVGLY